MNTDHLAWWSNLRHGGLFLDLQRLSALVSSMPEPLPEWRQDRLRREMVAFENDPGKKRSAFVGFVLDYMCGFHEALGPWYRGSNISTSWSRPAITGERIRPQHLWTLPNGAVLPVFIDTEKRIGIGRGKRVTSRALQWLRQGDEQLALITNGLQWRLVFAGLDYDAWVEWELDQWLAEGQVSDEFNGFRALLSPERWIPEEKGQPCPLLAAINDTRKGQSDLSKVLGERVRQAAELLIEGHAPALNAYHDHLDATDIYRAAVRVIMRMVVILFAESRDGLLPRDNRVYYNAYSLQGLRDQLDRTGPSRRVSNYSAWPRVLALFRLLYQGSSHEALPVPQYGGELFAPGEAQHPDGMRRALYLFERACFSHDIVNDALVRNVLDLLTRTRITIRQGRSSTTTTAPVDFSNLDSEYIGILYEGLLNYELRCTVDGQPIVFLAVGDQPALPLTTLESLDDKAIKNLFEKMKDTSTADEKDGEVEAPDDLEEESETEDDDETEGDPTETVEDEVLESEEDPHYTLRARAEAWARHAVVAAGLAKKPRGKLTPEKKMAFERSLDAKARQLVTKVVLPGEWYLVRWGGTRKGSGSFYTKPQLAIPTVHRTLEPLCYQGSVVSAQRPEASGQGLEANGQREHTGHQSQVTDHGAPVTDHGAPETGHRSPEAGNRSKDIDNLGGVDDGTTPQGTGGLATGDGPCHSGLQSDRGVSEGGDIRAHKSASPGRGVGPIEYSRRIGPTLHEGVSQSSIHGAGLPDGSRDPARNRPSTDLSDTTATDGTHRTNEDSRTPTQRPYTGTEPESMITDHRPPDTEHWKQDTDHRPQTPDHRIPRRPEDILAIKACDPACGSGSFPLAGLRYLTEALYESLLYHRRIRERGHGESVLALILDNETNECLAEERLPCRPDDAEFEDRTKAILRRYVVERCLYGVDLDPLAVELCRLSLWIETLDPRLPLTFLNHKIKCGNALVGAWFDQFLHYPAMAWNREGGDKSHGNGVHYKKEAWTKAIKERFKTVQSELKDYIDGAFLQYPVHLDTVRQGHDKAVAALQAIHELPIHDAVRRAERYQQLIQDPAFIRLKDAFDCWCALWFWPPDQLDKAPMPLAFAADALDDDTRALARAVAAEHRFFHWELEFPDVFTDHQPPASDHRSPATDHQPPATGFDAVFGNPPWDIAKPNSKEFFSAYVPLYRSYGKQEAIRVQTDLFRDDVTVERQWLTYNASFRALSNWMKYTSHPFGDRTTESGQGRSTHDLNLGERGRGSYDSSAQRHAVWKRRRAQSPGYADPEHAFQHQGGGDINLYKMFLEQAHALLCGPVSPATDHQAPTPDHRPQATDHRSPTGGRLGMIVPSGLYSDHGSRALRSLFLDQCQWEWLFGFDNREGIFDIAPLNKFNPVIIAKGGKQGFIRTAFNRHNIADWERAEDHAVDYPRDRVVQFSPKSLAILEIQSQRDLDVLTTIYRNSVLLGDEGPDGWGIKYATEFHMTNDSKLFPPRTVWEDWGYEPDEYSRWIRGPWQPIEQLWAELGVDPDRPMPIAPSCAERIRAGVARGEVAPTGGRLRCAQPPYDRLPIPRADLPEGIILSRDGSRYLHEDAIPIVTFTEANGRPLTLKSDGSMREVRGPAIALPLYQGPMVFGLSNNAAAYTGGGNSGAKWQRQIDPTRPVEPQYLLGRDLFVDYCSIQAKIVYRSLSGPLSNERSFIPALLPQLPCGNSLGTMIAENLSLREVAALVGAMDSFTFDWVLRIRLSGMNINAFYIKESAVPSCLMDHYDALVKPIISTSLVGARNAALFLQSLSGKTHLHRWATTEHEQIRLRSTNEAIVALYFKLDQNGLASILHECDYPLHISSQRSFVRLVSPKGLWRVDRYKHPEHRHTVLTLVAFHDLQEKIAECGGDVEQGIEAFCTQNDGEGWMLPETLRLADYGLGHDARAREPQPVRECFGPRFYDWQWAQTAEESWRECHLHARNLLGKLGYQALLDELAGTPTASGQASGPSPSRVSESGQLYFD